MSREVSREIIDHLMRLPEPSLEDVNLAKMRATQKYGFNKVLSNSEIISYLKTDEREKLIPVLKRKAVRTISGVTVIAVMTKPWSCPKTAPCAYCPGGTQVGVPQSYTGHDRSVAGS